MLQGVKSEGVLLSSRKVSYYCAALLDWTNSRRMSERPPSLSILGVPLKPPISTFSDGARVFSRALNCSPMMPIDASLSDNCTPDFCSFSSLGALLCPSLFTVWDGEEVGEEVGAGQQQGGSQSLPVARSARTEVFLCSCPCPLRPKR